MSWSLVGETEKGGYHSHLPQRTLGEVRLFK